MPVTHCLTNGHLGTDELNVPNISGGSLLVFNPPGGVGHRRGVIVMNHGLPTLGSQPIPIPPPTTTGGLFADTYGAFGSAMANTLCTNLATDGWVVICPPSQEDSYFNQTGAIYNDSANDSGYGARYLASTLHTFDHVYDYIQEVYGSTFPVIAGGMSMGSWRTIQIAINRTSDLVGWFAHQPLTMFENLSTGFTVGNQYGDIPWTGADLIGAVLPSSIPGIIGYGTNDNAVWWGGSSTLATVNSGTSGVAAASVNAVTVSGGSTNFESSASGLVTITGLSGGTSNGTATYSYTSYSAGSIGGMVLVAGSGTVNVGCSVIQSEIDSLLTTYSAHVTRNSTAEPHSLSITDTGAYYAGSATTISAINTATTLQLTPVQIQCMSQSSQALISTKCSIQDTTGAWHVVTFTGNSTPNLTGVSITGSGSIANGAPIMNTGTAITGGFSNISYPYWINQNLDPSYPANL